VNAGVEGDVEETSTSEARRRTFDVNVCHAAAGVRLCV
jgi:hypothetical protein